MTPKTSILTFVLFIILGISNGVHAQSNEQPNVNETTAYILQTFSNSKNLKSTYSVREVKPGVIEWKPKSCATATKSYYHVENGGRVDLREVEIITGPYNSYTVIHFSCVDMSNCNSVLFSTYSNGSGRCEDRISSNSESVPLGADNEYVTRKLLKAFRHLQSLSTGNKELF